MSLLKLKGDLLIIFQALRPDAGNIYAVTHALAVSGTCALHGDNILLLIPPLL